MITACSQDCTPRIYSRACLASSFCPGLDSKYFWLYRPYSFCCGIPVCHGWSHKSSHTQYVNEWAWLCAKYVHSTWTNDPWLWLNFMEIWIPYTFPRWPLFLFSDGFFFFFPSHLKMSKQTTDCTPLGSPLHLAHRPYFASLDLEGEKWTWVVQERKHNYSNPDKQSS